MKFLVLFSWQALHLWTQMLLSVMMFAFAHCYEFTSQTLWYDRLVSSNCAEGTSQLGVANHNSKLATGDHSCVVSLRALRLRFGFFMKREIPYSKIRGVEKVRRFYSDSMLSLKNSFDHLNIKYNTFDIISISVVGSEDFVSELSLRCERALSGA